jgi:hypothetical protein
VPIQDILANETTIRKEVILKMLAEEIDGKYVSFNNKNNNIDHNRSIIMDNKTICFVVRKL